jgi:hypothetical protein
VILWLRIATSVLPRPNRRGVPHIWGTDRGPRPTSGKVANPQVGPYLRRAPSMLVQCINSVPATSMSSGSPSDISPLQQRQNYEQRSLSKVSIYELCDVR